jgi:hypothetical protein
MYVRIQIIKNPSPKSTIDLSNYTFVSKCTDMNRTFKVQFKKAIGYGNLLMNANWNTQLPETRLPAYELHVTFGYMYH